MTRVLVHAHSTWSHDGHIPLTAYPIVAERAGCSVVLLTEHEESGWDQERYDAYVRACDAVSTPSVRVIPGLEFLQDGLHVLCYGLRRLPARPCTPLQLKDSAHRDGCVLTLAHPGKYAWRIPSGVLAVVDAVEVWNSKWIYDGAAGPHPESLRLAEPTRLMVGQDIHKLKHVSPLQLVCRSSDVLADLAVERFSIWWRDRHWSPDALREAGRALRPRAHRAWSMAVVTAYRASRPLRGGGADRPSTGRLGRPRPLPRRRACR